MQFIFLVRTILAPSLSLSPFLSFSRSFLSLFCLSFSRSHPASSAVSQGGSVAPGQTYASFHCTNPNAAWRNNCSSGRGFAGALSLTGSLQPGTRHFNQRSLSLTLFSLSLCLSASLYQTPDLLSNQTSALFTHKATHPLKGSFCSPLILSLTSLLFVLLSDRHIGDTDFLGGDRTAQYVSKPLFHFIFLFPINATYQVFFVFVQ